jgi:hypothetical protein
MAESLLYITFKDTVGNLDNPAMKQIAIENIITQLKAAASRISADPQAIYAYLRQDTPTVTAALIELPEVPAIPAVSVPAPILTEDEMMDMIFKDLKRTEKSQRIIKYLIQNSGQEISVDQLTSGASINKNDLSSWMAVIGCRVPAIVRVQRGCYKFNPDKLNIQD